MSDVTNTKLPNTFPATDETGRDYYFGWLIAKAFQWWSVVPFDENRPRIVGYYRHPDVDGRLICPYCEQVMHDHGFIDEPGNEHVVCPGDWVVTTSHHVAMKPAVFEAIFAVDTKGDPI